LAAHAAADLFAQLINNNFHGLSSYGLMPRPSGPPDQLLHTAAEAASELRHAGFDTEDVAAGLPFHFVIRATPASADNDTR
jgi:hypothetical protein